LEPLKSKDICVIGLGQIGLPTAMVFANSGFNVLGVDLDKHIVNQLNEGKAHIKETGLQPIVTKVVKSGRFKASLKPGKADIYLIAVPTHIKSDNTPDISAVEAAIRLITPYIKNGNLIIVESTVPPGTVGGTVKNILEQSGLKGGSDFYLAHCPERVLPGNILKEIIENDRIIGGINNLSTQRAYELYSTFVKGTIYTQEVTVVETTKLAENIYRDVNIALANELGNVCKTLGINVWEVIKLANKHPRVNLHLPGPGVGGHCIGVVPWFLASTSLELTPLIQLSRNINNNQPRIVANFAHSIVKHIPKPKITILGASYKANVPDARESPTTEIFEILRQANLEVSVTDPIAINFPYELIDFKNSLNKSDLIVIITDHKEFKEMDPNFVSQLMRTKQILDTRNCLNHSEWREFGFSISILGT